MGCNQKIVESNLASLCKSHRHNAKMLWVVAMQSSCLTFLCFMQLLECYESLLWNGNCPISLSTIKSVSLIAY